MFITFMLCAKHCVGLWATAMTWSPCPHGVYNLVQMSNSEVREMAYQGAVEGDGRRVLKSL